MENSLPPIKQMYNSTRENKDYNVIRKYQDFHKTQQMKKSITKKGHYLDDQIKARCSPGPANKSNVIAQWAPKDAFQPKYSNRKTYIDDVQRLSKKANSPSPDKYTISMNWPKKQNKVKFIGQKTTVFDTSQYESSKVPGPGSYMVATRISKQQKQNKFTPHQRLQPKQAIKADMTTYNPCPADYNTFMKYSMSPKNKGLQRKKSNDNLQKISTKKQSAPGPGAYQTINTWKGKEPLKKTQLSYLSHLTKGPSMNIYYH